VTSVPDQHALPFRSASSAMLGATLVNCPEIPVSVVPVDYYSETIWHRRSLYLLAG
jgi:hypothetical protein